MLRQSLAMSGKGTGINLILLDLVIADTVTHLQIPGGLQHIAVRMLQGVDKQLLLEARHSIVERQSRPAVPGRLEVLGQMGGAQDEIVASLYSELHALGQLPGIARPRVLQEEFLRRRRNALHSAPHSLGGRLEEHIRQRKDVFRAFTQWGQGNGKRGNPIVQVLKKGALGNQRFQIRRR